MATLACDLCGGKLVMGTGGIAVCDDCGMEYSAARMKEKVQELRGAVQTGNSNMVSNYLRLAQNAYASGNKEEAENYCNKIIELEPSHAEAWFLKGQAAGWQSTLANIRFSEAINCFANAIESTPEDEKEALIEKCKDEIMELSQALLRLRAGRFKKWPDEEEKAGFLQDLAAVMRAILQFFDRIGTLIDKNELMTPLADIINDAVVGAWNNVVRPTFEKDHDGYPDDYELKRLIKRVDYCISLLSQAVTLSDDDDEGDILRYKNMIVIQEYLIDAQSYSYETVQVGNSWLDGSAIYDNKYVKSKSLTEEAKRIRRSLIRDYQTKIVKIEQKIAAKEAAKEAEKDRIAKEEAQRRIEEFWAEHADEKAQLESDREEVNKEIDQINAALEQQVAELKNEIEAIPGADELARFDETIDRLTQERNSISVFKMKERKAVQEQIDQTEEAKRELWRERTIERNRIEEEIRNATACAQQKIAALGYKLIQIKKELEKAR